MTLAWSNTNDWCDSSNDAPRHNGLTPFGCQVIAEMNRLGMLVDLSHVSDAAFWQSIDTSTSPVIASHSAARALTAAPRNLTDDQLRAIAESGGVVMVNFFAAFLSEPFRAAWNAQRTAREAGIWSDFDGIPLAPAGIDSAADLHRITAGLLARGWHPRDLRGLLGENILRTLDHAQP